MRTNVERASHGPRTTPRVGFASAICGPGIDLELFRLAVVLVCLHAPIIRAYMLTTYVTGRVRYHPSSLLALRATASSRAQKYTRAARTLVGALPVLRRVYVLHWVCIRESKYPRGYAAYCARRHVHAMLTPVWGALLSWTSWKGSVEELVRARQKLSTGQKRIEAGSKVSHI